LSNTGGQKFSWGANSHIVELLNAKSAFSLVEQLMKAKGHQPIPFF
jgi:hypothetical protein